MTTLKSLKFVVLASLLLVLAFAAVPSAGAQPQGIIWTTGIQVQNLGSGAANVTLTFYSSASGTSVGSTSSVIAAGGSVSFFPVPVVAAGFAGSAVVSADQPVAAIMNLLGNGGAYGGSAIGLSAGSTSVGLPLIMKDNSGFDTWFNVQNAGTAVANITINYKPGGAGTAFSETSSIQPGAAKTFDQFGKTALGAKFVGSATITSNQPIVAVVNQVGKTVSKTLLTYDGFGAGSATVDAPLIMANNSGFLTSINIQNVSLVSANITINYGPNTAGAFDPANETFTLAAGAGTAKLQAGAAWPQKFVGGATITSNQPIVVVVNQIRTTGVSVGSAYEGFNPTALTTKSSLPLLMANNGGYLTSANCKNPGTTAITINVTYSKNAAGAFQPTNITGKTVAAGATAVILQAGTSEGTTWGTNKYVGGATVTATGGNVACLVNQLIGNATGDQFLTYTGINF
jgi:hypothetical protein